MLFNKITIDVNSSIYIWDISESFEDLFDQVSLKDISLIRLNNMKSELHQKGFLGVRMLLQEIGYSDADLFYDDTGKPLLSDEKNISITHSFNKSVIAISDQTIGIDIEKIRNKIALIASKFCETEFEFLDKHNEDDYLKKLTVIWGIKESVFKIKNEIGISFKDHIAVFPFEMDEGVTSAILDFNGKVEEFIVRFFHFEDYILVYASKK